MKNVSTTWHNLSHRARAFCIRSCYAMHLPFWWQVSVDYEPFDCYSIVIYHTSSTGRVYLLAMYLSSASTNSLRSTSRRLSLKRTWYELIFPLQSWLAPTSAYTTYEQLKQTNEAILILYGTLLERSLATTRP